jgi:hypothetical protein
MQVAHVVQLRPVAAKVAACVGAAPWQFGFQHFEKALARSTVHHPLGWCSASIIMAVWRLIRLIMPLGGVIRM